jgi:hypothetical protein
VPASAVAASTSAVACAAAAVVVSAAVATVARVVAIRRVCTLAVNVIVRFLARAPDNSLASSDSRTCKLAVHGLRGNA